MNTVRLARRVKKLLNKHGSDMVVSTFTTSTAYNPSTGTNVVTSTDQTVKGLVFEWGGANYPNNGAGVIDWTLIRQDDMKLTLSPFDNSGNQTIIPKTGDIVLVFDRLYTITQPIKALEPDGNLLLIECNIRGAS